MPEISQRVTWTWSTKYETYDLALNNDAKHNLWEENLDQQSKSRASWEGYTDVHLILLRAINDENYGKDKKLMIK